MILQSTTIATLASQTSFTLTAGSPDNDAYNGMTIVIEDATTSEQKAVGTVSGYVGSTKTITLIRDPGIFTMVATDKITIVTEATASSVWDEDLTGATHNVPTSSGRRLRSLQDFSIYEDAAIWIDTINGTSGTTDFENGTPNLPVDNIADANTLAASLNLSRFHIINGSLITLAATQTNQVFTGQAWTLALGGQNVSGTEFEGANVSGSCTGAAQPHFVHCNLDNVTIPPAYVGRCSLRGTITLQNSGDYFIHDCFSAVAGTGTPVINFGVAITNTNMNMRSYSGGIEVENVGVSGTDNMSLEGWGQLIVNANCTGGTIAIRGSFDKTDNSGGAVTFSEDARFVNSELVDLVWDEILSKATHNVAQSAGKILRNQAAIVSIDCSIDDVTPSAISFISDCVETTDDFYIDQNLVFTSGGLQGQSRVVSAYNGTTKLVTVDEAFSFAPADGDDFSILSPHIHPVSQIADTILAASMSELPQGAPSDTPTVEQVLMTVYMALVNEIDITATFKSFKNGAGTVIWKKPLSDNGNAYSEAKGITGP